MLKSGKLASLVQKKISKDKLHVKLKSFKKWMHYTNVFGNRKVVNQNDEDLIKLNIQNSLMEYTFKLMETMQCK